MNELERLQLSFKVYNVPNAIQLAIIIAFEWARKNPKKFDGATGDKELWVSLYEPAALVHDYLYVTGRANTYKDRLLADRVFKKIMKTYRVPGIWIRLRYWAVRLGGIYFAMKNRKTKQRVEPEQLFKEII